jgi:hypothetical protein
VDTAWQYLKRIKIKIPNLKAQEVMEPSTYSLGSRSDCGYPAVDATKQTADADAETSLPWLYETAEINPNTNRWLNQKYT